MAGVYRGIVYTSTKCTRLSCKTTLFKVIAVPFAGLRTVAQLLVYAVCWLVQLPA